MLQILVGRCMTSNKTTKFVSSFIVTVCLISYIMALCLHDIPSYEQDSLCGVPLLLHWCMIIYLPLFPIISGLLSLAISSKISFIGVTVANFSMTLIFCIFAYSSDVLSTSWMLLTLSSFSIMCGAIYEVRTQNR